MAMMALGGCIGWDGPAECILGFCDIVIGSLISQQMYIFIATFAEGTVLITSLDVWSDLTC